MVKECVYWTGPAVRGKHDSLPAFFGTCCRNKIQNAIKQKGLLTHFNIEYIVFVVFSVENRLKRVYKSEVLHNIPTTGVVEPKSHGKIIHTGV